MSGFQKGLWLGLVVLMAGLMLSACSGEPEEDPGPVVACINDYEITLKEYETQLASDVSMSEIYTLTEKDKRSFLERLIRKEILIQEATRLKLDQRETFIRAIERYWESTLIRDLMELKGEEICDRACITEEAIRARYEEMAKTSGYLPPFEEMRKRIGKSLLEEKRQKRLETWMEELRSKTDVKVNEEVCFQKK